MKSFKLLVLVCATILCQSASGLTIHHTEKFDVYTPMVELGKKWVYGIYSHNRGMYEGESPDHSITYQIDDIQDIDGQEYYVINDYTDGSDTPNPTGPVAYMREDVTAKKIWIKPCKDYRPSIAGYSEPHLDGTEQLYYDFNDEPKCAFYEYSEYPWGEKITPIVETYNNFSYKGFEVTKDYKWIKSLEGIGYLEQREIKIDNDRTVYTPSTLFGMAVSYQYFSEGSQHYYPFLIAVYSPTGEEMYAIEKHRFAGVENVSTNTSMALTVNVSGNKMLVSSAGSLGHVAVYNISGAEIHSSEVVTSSVEFDVAPGIYVVTAQGQTKKIVVK